MSGEKPEELAQHRQAIERLLPFLDAIQSIAEMAWRRTEQSLEPLVRYRRQLDAAVDQLLATREVARRWEALARSAHGRPTGLLLISSERGLCGPFNSRLVSFALEQAQSLAANGTEVQLLCLGRQGKRLLEEAGRPLLYTRSLPALSAPSHADVEAVTLDLLGFIEEGRLGEVLAVHHVPFQRFQYRPQVTPLFPIPLRATERRGSRPAIRPADDLEPFMVHLLTERMLVDLYAAVLHSSVSEQLARIYTMRLASENAKKLLDRLTMEYNLARSNAITSSLLEVIGGYEASQAGQVGEAMSPFREDGELQWP